MPGRCAADLLEIGGGRAAGYRADTSHERGAFRGGDNATSVHQVEKVRALEAMIVRREERVTNAILPFRGLETVEEILGLLFMELEFGTNGGGVAAIEAVHGELLLFHEANVAVGFVRGPTEIVDTFYALEKRADAFEAIGKLNGNGVEVDAAALLEVGELCDFEAVEEDLPADTPGTEGRRFPIVLFEANVVFFELDANSTEALEVEVLDVYGRRLEDHLKLRMLVEAIGIFAVAAVGGPTTRLHVADAIGVEAKDTEKGFRMHRAGADFDIVRLLEDAALLYPKLGELQDQILEG